MGGVLLQDAHVACIGGGRDEALCRDVAQILTSSGRHPFVKHKSSKRRRRREGIDHSRSLQILRDETRRALEASGQLSHGPGRIGADDSESSDNSSNSGEGGVQLGGSTKVRPCGHQGGASTRNRPAPADTLGIRRLGEVSDMRQARRAKALPAMQLSARAEQVLQHVVAKGHVAAQPAYKEDVRTARKGRADSAMRNDYARWLTTADGIHYQNERAALATGEARPGGDGRPGGGAAKSASSTCAGAFSKCFPVWFLCLLHTHDLLNNNVGFLCMFVFFCFSFHF